MGFTALDYGVLILYLAGSVSLGFYFARFQKTSRDYFLGSRDIPWTAISLSIVATETSTLTFIGIPALAYGGDMTFLQITFGYFLARIVISLFFLPAYYRGDLFTAYAFIERRFGNKARNLSSGIFLVTRLLADGVRLFATAIPLAIITGLSYPTSITIICIVTIVYTYLGGLRAVVWLDVIQIIIYLGGAALAFFAIIGKMPDGWQQIVAVGETAHKFKIWDFHFDWTTTYTIFSGVIGGTFLTMASHGTDQLMVQRLLAARDLRSSQKALIGSGFLIIGQFFFFLLLGVMLFAFYQTFPGQLQIGKTDEVFPFFIVHELPAGISGLVIAAIFAAAMSTLSSSLNSLASSTIMDWIKPIFRPDWSEKQEMFFSRLTTVAWAALLILVATLAGSWGNVLEAGLKIASFTYGGLLGAFLLGLSSQRVQQREAIIAILVGLATMVLVIFGIWRSPAEGWVFIFKPSAEMLVERGLQAIAWPWYVFIGATATYITGHGCRWILPRRQEK